MDTQENTLTFINCATLLISFPGNVFIIVVTFLDSCKSRRLPINNQLILGFSVFSLLHGLQKGYLQYKELYKLASNEYDKKATHVFMYLNLCTLWFSALLCVHFCLKVVNINHKFYIRLQKRFPSLFPWIIFSFLLGYFFLSLSSALEMKEYCILNSTTKVVTIKMSPRCSWSMLIFIVICGLCGFFCTISALTILISLLKHIRRIRENSEGSRSPNMDAHIRAILTVTTLLAANILIFISVFLSIFCEALVLPFGILISICHIFSSYYLIRGTKKLEETLVEILNLCLCCRNKN
ncbi:taste receptor type 2 member 10-like [Anomaloglossus baeobatrachus]|uniref:taste receptor type 2 member 10-like n=1 Tax=Anomaloglossus baeobatrachus TaxID=238106 RepID=UPI003F50D262